MIKTIEMGAESSKNLAISFMSILAGDNFKKVTTDSSKNLGFIKFKSDISFRECAGAVRMLFDKHSVEYQFRLNAPLGIHIKNLDSQTAALYKAYEETVFMTCEENLSKLPEYQQGSVQHIGGVTNHIIPGVVNNEGGVLKFLREQAFLTYQSISTYLSEKVSLSPVALLFNAEVLYRDGQKTQSFAWYVFAKARITADAQKCTDVSCKSSASMVPMTFISNLGDLSSQWAAEKDRDTDHYQIALELYQRHPQSHQPAWLADQGIANFCRSFGVGTSGDRFLPEAECIAIERKSLESLHKLAREQGKDNGERPQPPTYTDAACGDTSDEPQPPTYTAAACGGRSDESQPPSYAAYGS